MSTTATKPDLRGKLSEVNEQVSGLRSEAGAAWKEFEDHRDQFVAAGNEASRVDSDEFKAADETHRRYNEKKDKLTEVEAFRDSLISMLGDEPPADPVADAGKAGKGSGDPDEVIRKPLDVKSFAERAAEAPEYKTLLESGQLDSERRKFGTAALGKSSRGELKALLTGVSDTSGGAFVVNDLQPYQAQPTRPLTVVDLISVGATDSDTVEYVRQSAWTNVAAETAEATSITTGTKPEATIAFAKVTEAVKTIAHWIPATRRALADAAQLQTLVEQLLRFGLDLRLEDQIVNGNGTGENLTGILNTGGILTQAQGADIAVVAIHKAITQLRLGFVEPSGAVMHPTDWETVRLTRDASGGAGTGSFMYGPPAMAGTQQIWGLPIAVTPAIPDDTALVGAFQFATLWLREGIQVLASDSHDDFFIKNLVAILAEMRAAFGVRLAQAFCKVTSVD